MDYNSANQLVEVSFDLVNVLGIVACVLIAIPGYYWLKMILEEDD